VSTFINSKSPLFLSLALSFFFSFSLYLCASSFVVIILSLNFLSFSSRLGFLFLYFKIKSSASPVRSFSRFNVSVKLQSLKNACCFVFLCSFAELNPLDSILFACASLSWSDICVFSNANLNSVWNYFNLFPLWRVCVF